ncbi:MAG: hypothetical protein JXQ72_01560 [Anaerolineae bacterium]|nr:hypothetical protein [Anaerolineae bacterium]
MEDVHAFVMPGWDISANIDAEGERMMFASYGSGALELPMSLIALMSDMPDMESVQTLQDMTPLINLLRMIDAEWVKQVASELVLEVDIERVMLMTPDESQEGSLSLIVKDGLFYLKAPELIGDSDWYGVSFDDLLASMDINLAELDVAMEELITELENLDLSDLSEVEGLSPEMMHELQAMGEELNELLLSFEVVTRGPDESLHDQAMATFVSEYDITGLLLSMDLAEMLARLVNNPAFADLFASGDSMMGEMQVDELQMHLLLTAVALIMRGSSFSVEQWVGLDDTYIHKLGLHAVLALDVSPVEGLLGGDMGMGMDIDMPTEPINMSFDFTVEIDEHNALSPDAVVPPADYEPMPLEELQLQ